MSVERLSNQWPSGLNKLAHDRVLIILAFSLLAISGCSSPTPTNIGAPLPPSTSKNATITADPNPIQVCDSSSTGITKLTWTSVGPALVEVHVNSPNGDLLARTGANGTATTGKWVRDGMSFYLQDVTNGKPLTPENTLATITFKTTSAGCQ